MARENHIILNGRIEKLAKFKKDNEIVQIAVALLVLRRPSSSVGNRAGTLKTDVVLVYIRKKELIEYLEDNHAAKGDMLEVSGIFCTVHGLKKFHCKNCQKENSFVGSMSYVNALCIRLDEIYPKHTEIVNITEVERDRPKEEVIEIINSRKAFQGQIIEREELAAKNGIIPVRITVRRAVTDKDTLKWLQWMGEISNRIYLIGNVCADPIYNPIENGGRVCTYQLGINRKVYIKEDDPTIRADYPWIKSLGDQADKDRDALIQGSLVFIEGSVQARDDFVIQKECEYCGTVCQMKGQAMEIVPYSVEYLKNCMSLEEDEETFEEVDEWSDDTEENPSTKSEENGGGE